MDFIVPGWTGIRFAGWRLATPNGTRPGPRRTCAGPPESGGRIPPAARRWRAAIGHDPSKGKRRTPGAESAKVPNPDSAHAVRMTRRETVAVKSNMPHFIAQDQPAHRHDRRIIAVTADHAVVNGAHNLHNEQDQHFELHATRSPAGVERPEGKRAGDEFAAQPAHRPPEQPRVLALFVKPKIDHRANLVCLPAIVLRVAGDEPARPAAITELILREGERQRPPLRFTESGRGIPLGLGTIGAVGTKVGDPMGVVHLIKQRPGVRGESAKVLRADTAEIGRTITAKGKHRQFESS